MTKKPPTPTTASAQKKAQPSVSKPAARRDALTLGTLMQARVTRPATAAKKR